MQKRPFNIKSFLLLALRNEFSKDNYRFGFDYVTGVACATPFWIKVNDLVEASLKVYNLWCKTESACYMAEFHALQWQADSMLCKEKDAIESLDELAFWATRQEEGWVRPPLIDYMAHLPNHDAKMPHITGAYKTPEGESVTYSDGQVILYR